MSVPLASVDVLMNPGIPIPAESLYVSDPHVPAVPALEAGWGPRVVGRRRRDHEHLWSRRADRESFGSVFKCVKDVVGLFAEIGRVRDDESELLARRRTEVFGIGAEIRHMGTCDPLAVDGVFTDDLAIGIRRTSRDVDTWRPDECPLGVDDEEDALAITASPVDSALVVVLNSRFSGRFRPLVGSVIDLFEAV